MVELLATVIVPVTLTVEPPPIVRSPRYSIVIALKVIEESSFKSQGLRENLQVVFCRIDERDCTALSCIGTRTSVCRRSTKPTIGLLEGVVYGYPDRRRRHHHHRRCQYNRLCRQLPPFAVNEPFPVRVPTVTRMEPPASSSTRTRPTRGVRTRSPIGTYHTIERKYSQIHSAEYSHHRFLQQNPLHFPDSMGMVEEPYVNPPIPPPWLLPPLFPP